MATPISILTEVPEELHQSLRNYLDTHPTWDQDQVITIALSLFLLNSQARRFAADEHPEVSPDERSESQSCAQAYLEALFQV